MPNSKSFFSAKALPKLFKGGEITLGVGVGDEFRVLVNAGVASGLGGLWLLNWSLGSSDPGSSSQHPQ